VLYGGRVMEQATADDIFYRPTHPYTVGLLGAIARLDQGDAPLKAIPGSPPNMARAPAGCPFHPRCTLADDLCRTQLPALAVAGEQPVTLRACHRSIAEVAVLRAPATRETVASEALHG
jgi:oligopeptide transport system ATP-binding protein